AASLSARRLLIVTSGALEYIPFSVLPDPARPSAILATEHEVANLPSASALAVLRPETSGRRAAPKAVAVLADPVFSANDPRAASARQSPAERDVKSALEPLGTEIPRLPFTRQEAAGIAALLPADQRKQALD